MVSYRYEPLDIGTEEIRLLRLLPGNFDDDLSLQVFHIPLPSKNEIPSCRASIEDVQRTLSNGWEVRETLQGRYIFHHSLLDLSSWDHPQSHVDRSLYAPEEDSGQSCYEPEYEALSYFWGPQDDTVRVRIINAEGSPSMCLDIGHSLACALRHLRFSEKPRVLWVDAICINQNDLVERNQQVKRMARIYSSAARVVVWLGEASSDSRLAMDILGYIASQVECSVDGYSAVSPGAIHKWWNRNTPMDYDEQAWAAISSMFHRPWYSRVWVLQEVNLANQQTIVQCGGDCIPWSSMRSALTVLRSNVSTPPVLSDLLQRMRLAFNPGKRYFTTPRLLQASRGRESTDPRDKVYGVLSLAPPSIQKAVMPQYALPPQDVYLQLFLAEMNSTSRLDLLGDCRLEQAMEHSPTWLPNWTTKVASFLSFDIQRFQRIPAGLSACHVDLDHPSPGRITVRGVEAAQVQSVGMLATSGDPSHLRQILRSWGPRDLRTAAYPAGGTLLNAYLEVIFLGATRDRYPENGDYSTLADAQNSHDDFVSGRSASIYMPWGTAQYDRVVMFSTKEGYIGLGPAGLQEGDQLCVILGCNAAPMLLRPVHAGAYSVVGPCFVHGLMDAEAVLGTLPPFWSVMWKRVEGFGVPYFYNSKTQEVLSEDPRLPGLAMEWRQIVRPRGKNDPEIFGSFHNMNSGEWMNSDPRLLPNALKERGVQLKDFPLI